MKAIEGKRNIGYNAFGVVQVAIAKVLKVLIEQPSVISHAQGIVIFLGVSVVS